MFSDLRHMCRNSPYADHSTEYCPSPLLVTISTDLTGVRRVDGGDVAAHLSGGLWCYPMEMLTP
jgi:hypothetical protein